MRICNQRFSMLATIVVALAIASTTFACMCKLEAPSKTFCRSHWVAHVKVLDSADNVTIPGHTAGGERMYTVAHKQIFKTPQELNETLPTVVFSPLAEASCGLELIKGHEYLLSGRYINGTAVSMLCGQMLPEDAQSAVQNDILEWNEVATNVVESLRANLYVQQCNEPLYASEKPPTVAATTPAAAPHHEAITSPSATAPAPSVATPPQNLEAASNNTSA